ncbi:MAG: hypothetical protein RL154_1502 [Pseudomonadota bacterium]|jgi:hypothetical protein
MQSSDELENAKQAMQECQRVKGFLKAYNDIEYSTCEPCDELFSCLVRKQYVDMVYFSMNGGGEGGFEF